MLLQWPLDFNDVLVGIILIRDHQMVIMLNPFERVHDNDRAALLQIPVCQRRSVEEKTNSLESSRIRPAFDVREELICTMLRRSLDIAVVCLSVRLCLVDFAPVERLDIRPGLVLTSSQQLLGSISNCTGCRRLSEHSHGEHPPLASLST
jgi:hypothetical protein